MPRRTHSPLEYNYHSHRPLATMLWLLNKPWWYYILFLGVYTVKHSPALLMPMATAFVLNSLKAGRYVFTEWWFIAAALLFLAQHIPMNTLFADMASNVQRQLEMRLRGAIARRLQQLSISFHDDTETGRLQAKMLRDVDVIAGVSYAIPLTVFGAMMTLVFAISTTLARQPKMILFFLVIVPAAVILQRVFRKPMRKRSHEFRNGFEAMSAKVTEMVQMIPVTRAHAVERTELDTVDEHLDTVRRKGRRLDRIMAFFGGSVWISMMTLRVSCLAFTAWLYHRGTPGVDIGDVILYTAFFDMMRGAVEGLLHIMPMFTNGRESIRSIGEVLECPDIEANENKNHVERVEGRLTFEDVSFTYPSIDRPAVEAFNLDIEPGQCVAFVGESGSGKSTLMNLTIGFRRPTEGRILLDGVDMENLDLRTYRQFLAVVPQQTVLLSGSIRENILYGLNGVTDQQLRHIIEAANVAEFTDTMPDKLDTIVGESGAKLSGGQRQRIAVARALIRDPKVIILDEATSALDVISEALVQEAIDRLVADRTTLIVAHRLSTIRKADRIVVMKGGRCIEYGPPQDLLEAEGEFHKLHSLQQMLLGEQHQQQAAAGVYRSVKMTTRTAV
ncbi:MAG: ABC transporter ATP-binding protein [Planctomycetota bacterium]|jgi:ATP-binding cassette subfamily B protein